MVLKGDKVIINNTYRFVFPILRLYGEEYVKRMDDIFKLAVFIDDLTNPRYDKDDYLHVVIDPLRVVKQPTYTLENTIAWMESKGILNKAYKLESDPNKMVLMIRIPEKYQGCVGLFVEGNTALYSKADTESCFCARNKVNEAYFKYCRSIILAKTRIKIDLDEELLNF